MRAQSQTLRLLVEAAEEGPLVRLRQAKLQSPGDRARSIEHPQTKQQASHTPTVGRSLLYLVSLAWESGKMTYSIPSGLLVSMKKGCCHILDIL